MNGIQRKLAVLGAFLYNQKREILHKPEGICMYLLRWKTFFWGVGVVIVAFAIWAGYVLHLIAAIEATAVARRADVAIVLGAAIWGDKPSPALRERLDQACLLYEQGYVPYLLVSGGTGSDTQLAEAAVMKEYLLAKGIPEQRIITENKATSTFENLAYSKELMEQHHFHTALVVSHGFHLARAEAMARVLQMDTYPVASSTQSLFIPYHKAREVFAYTKWKVSEWLS
jgi:uncharacterized SAM-binding protein YcdF (DUF218 family)